MFGHDYAVPGTYEVTIAVAGRQPVFGQVQGTTKAGGEPPHIVPSALGRAVLNDEIPKIHHYYPMVDVWQVCLMPDHMHLIVRINKPLPTGKHLGISECEKRIKNMALRQRLRLIHLQKEPIGKLWKPERSRFEACASGSLLVLAPWPEDMPAFGSDYERFHYLNRLTEAVCAVSHTTDVGVHGLRHVHGGG